MFVPPFRNQMHFYSQDIELVVAWSVSDNTPHQLGGSGNNIAVIHLDLTRTAAGGRDITPLSDS